MQPGEALRAVAALLERLPPAVYHAVAGLEVTVADRPGPGALARGVPADTAGIYLQPDPRTLDPTEDDEPPPPAGRIVLYLSNIKPLDVHGVQAIFMHEAARKLIVAVYQELAGVKTASAVVREAQKQLKKDLTDPDRWGWWQKLKPWAVLGGIVVGAAVAYPYAKPLLSRFSRKAA